MVDPTHRYLVVILPWNIAMLNEDANTAFYIMCDTGNMGHARNMFFWKIKMLGYSGLIYDRLNGGSIIEQNQSWLDGTAASTVFTTTSSTVAGVVSGAAAFAAVECPLGMLDMGVSGGAAALATGVPIAGMTQVHYRRVLGDGSQIARMTEWVNQFAQNV